ncbi:MAG: Cell envelope-related transcriptional attenuator [Microgenomates group bacterium GW2011_GWC1_43_13]|nr:MAG: Cell envelope-related transcriptional attenuator [Microgenomates group bacterium GW2011_GWC1_43_13]OGM76522.1 MAG: hypothetical protein A2208_00860 [Candidatus Woesebacteria bacterium RIFOXYA1_FULL_43_16]OGM82604.1 MAG: hypothetical protein A2394_02820 [Candidatus Woesebacteria bacterium RIFOXYB1_FULL_42_36]
MPDKEANKDRKRVVVEEVAVTKEAASEPDILPAAAKDNVPSEPESIVEEKVTEVKRNTVEVEPRKSPSIALWIIIPGIFLLGAILGGIVFYQKGVNRNQEEVATPSSSPINSAAPSPSPVKSEDLTRYTVNILNGSGIAGEAGKVKTLLTTAGFKVGTTGNASTYDYTKTVIKAKSTVDASYISALSAALGKTYAVDTVQSLENVSTDTVQVIVGSSKAE